MKNRLYLKYNFQPTLIEIRRVKLIELATLQPLVGTTGVPFNYIIAGALKKWWWCRGLVDATQQ